MRKKVVQYSPERAMATRSTPPRGSRALRALVPKSFSRKFGPWLASSACRKLAVSSTGGRLAYWIKQKEISQEYSDLLLSLPK